MSYNSNDNPYLHQYPDLLVPVENTSKFDVVVVNVAGVFRQMVFLSVE